MKNAKLIVALVLTILVVIVALQNTAPVETKILFATVSMSRALLLAVTFAAGGLLGLAAGLWTARSGHKGTEQ